MSNLYRITLAEAKLFLREPMSVVFGVFFPTALMLALGAIPALREPSAEYGGARFVELWAPTSLVLGLGVVGFQHIPVAVATYRENGVLRRLATTPFHPAKLLGAQLIVAFCAATVSGLLVVVTAWLALDVPLPRHPASFVLAFVVGFSAVLAIGMLVAAVATTTRVAHGLAITTYMVAMFAGGVFLPRFLMPDFLIRLGDYTPPGVQAILDAWTDDTKMGPLLGGADMTGPPAALQLGIMALIAIAAGGAAAKLFRWE